MINKDEYLRLKLFIENYDTYSRSQQNYPKDYRHALKALQEGVEIMKDFTRDYESRRATSIKMRKQFPNLYKKK